MNVLNVVNVVYWEGTETTEFCDQNLVNLTKTFFLLLVSCSCYNTQYS